MLDAFDKGRRKMFFDLWGGHVRGKGNDGELDLQKLEFYLNVHFAIFARKHRVDVSIISKQ